MKKGELARLRDVVAVQQSQIDAWRSTSALMVQMWEDERARADALEQRIRQLVQQVEDLASACRSKS